MKKIIISALVALCALACAFSMVACQRPSNGSSSLEMAENKIEMVLGQTKQLSVKSLEKGETVSYTSNDESVVTVSADGVVEGVKIGSAVIKVVSSLERSALVPVTVYDPESYPVPYIAVAESEVIKCLGDSFEIEYTYTYLGEAIEGQVELISEDPSIISVEGNVLTAVGVGETTVQFKGESSLGTAIKTVKITVMAESAEFYPSFLGKDVFAGHPIDLKMYANSDGKLTVIEGASFSSNDTEIVVIEDGKLTPVKGGDTEIVVTFEHGGKEYSEQIPVHVYGFNTCTFVLADGTVDHTVQAFYGENISLSIENQLQNPEYEKEIKCWYVNGEEVTGDSFMMPDENVVVDVRFVNETEEDFSSRFSAGHLLGDAQAKVKYINEPFVDGKGVSSDFGGYVRFGDNDWASLCYNFDNPVVVNEFSKVKMKVYMPDTALLLYFGYATSENYNTENLTKRYEASAGVHKTGDVPLCIIPENEWTVIEMPLSAFVDEIGSQLNGISISVAHGAIYIDYVLVEEGLAVNDPVYMDNLLFKSFTLAEEGSEAQIKAINDYATWARGASEEHKASELHKANFEIISSTIEAMTDSFLASSPEDEELLVAIEEYRKWHNGLTAEQKNAEKHQENVTAINTIIQNKFAGSSIFEIYVNDPTVDKSRGALDQGERIQSGWGLHHTEYKTSYEKFVHMIQITSGEYDTTITLPAFNFNEYAEVYFGLFAITSEGWGTVTIAGQSFSFDKSKSHSFMVSIVNGVLTMKDDSVTENDGGGVIFTAELSEEVAGGAEKLVIDCNFEAWSQVEVTELHAVIEIEELD